MEENFLTIIKDGFSRLYRYWGAWKFGIFAILLAIVLIALIWYAIGGFGNWWHQTNTDAKIAASDQAAQRAADERDAAINQANLSQGKADQLETEKNALQKEKDELLNRYTDLRAKSEEFRVAYENDKKAKLNTSGLTTQRYNDLKRELDLFEGPDASPQPGPNGQP